jgi:hypothetical protein
VIFEKKQTRMFRGPGFILRNAIFTLKVLVNHQLILCRAVLCSCSYVRKTVQCGLEGGGPHLVILLTKTLGR